MSRQPTVLAAEWLSKKISWVEWSAVVMSSRDARKLNASWHVSQKCASLQKRNKMKNLNKKADERFIVKQTTGGIFVTYS